MVASWSGGTLKGTGPTPTATLGTNMTIDGSLGAMTLDNRSLINNGTITYGASTNGLTLINGAGITNQGSATFSAQGDAAISGGTFTNTGSALLT